MLLISGSNYVIKTISHSTHLFLKKVMYCVLIRHIDCGLIKKNILKNHFVFLKSSSKTKLYSIKIERLLYYGVYVFFSFESLLHEKFLLYKVQTVFLSFLFVLVILKKNTEHSKCFLLYWERNSVAQLPTIFSWLGRIWNDLFVGNQNKYVEFCAHASKNLK